MAQLMRRAIHQLLYVQANSSVMNGINSGDRIIAITPKWQIILRVASIAFAVLAALCIFMRIRAGRRAKKSAQSQQS